MHVDGRVQRIPRNADLCAGFQHGQLDHCFADAGNSRHFFSLFQMMSPATMISAAPANVNASGTVSKKR